jgi:hypothetical protein
MAYDSSESSLWMERIYISHVEKDETIRCIPVHSLLLVLQKHHMNQLLHILNDIREIIHLQINCCIGMHDMFHFVDGDENRKMYKIWS